MHGSSSPGIAVKIYSYIYAIQLRALTFGSGDYLRGNFFVCRVFSTKSVQNLKSFWRTSQIRFILALLYSLLTA